MDEHSQKWSKYCDAIHQWAMLSCDRNSLSKLLFVPECVRKTIHNMLLSHICPKFILSGEQTHLMIIVISWAKRASWKSNFNSANIPKRAKFTYILWRLECWIFDQTLEKHRGKCYWLQEFDPDLNISSCFTIKMNWCSSIYVYVKIFTKNVHIKRRINQNFRIIIKFWIGFWHVCNAFYFMSTIKQLFSKCLLITPMAFPIYCLQPQNFVSLLKAWDTDR